MSRSLWINCCGSVAVGCCVTGSVAVGWSLWVACFVSIATLISQSVALLVGCCGLIAVIWSLWSVVCGLVAVVWSLWFGHCGFAVLIGRCGLVWFGCNGSVDSFCRKTVN